MNKIRLIKILIVFITSIILMGFSEVQIVGQTSESLKTIINNSAKLQAKFYYSPSLSKIGQPIKFYNASTGNPEKYLWSFGDGKISEEKEPLHIYAKPSVYNVTLLVSKDNLISLASKLVLIKLNTKSANSQLLADFIYEPENPEAGTTVTFYDQSIGNPEKRVWEFGYFGRSLLKNPRYIFFSEGKYKISLTVENESGKDTSTKYIEIKPLPKNVILANSCSLQDVKEAIKKANPGDTVIVPNGEASWAQALVITKGIILKAGQVGGVTIRSAGMAVSATGYGDPNNYLIFYQPSGDQLTQPFRLSGFVLDMDNRRFAFGAKNTFTTTPVSNFRIDHCTFLNTNPDSKYSVLIFYGEVYGVLDNNTINSPNGAILIRDFGLNSTTWSNWTFEYGTENNRYYEDNVFIMGSDFIDEGGLGGRYCSRYNQIYHQSSNLCNPYDMHGNMGTGGNHSTMGVEIYGNTINAGGRSFRLFGHRGGKALIYNNTVTNAGGDSCYGGTVLEENDDNLNPPATNPAGQPQHVSDSYYWNNVVNGTVRYPIIMRTLDYGGDKGVVPRWDVYCWKEVSNFDGSSGIGVGPLTRRPATCTREGVAWWATDENSLYRWKNGKWELYYTPYAYPHPLRTSLGD